MNRDWNSYITKVNDELASVLVDLGLDSEIPDTNGPWLLWVWIQLKSPRPDGLSDWPEFEVLSAVEARLTQSLAQKCNGVLGGSITTLGRREFYFYGTNPEQLEIAVIETRKVFRDHVFEWGSREDSDWQQYTDVLLPSDEQMERIKNRKVLEILKKEGDLLADSREVTHWAYFKAAKDREGFKNAVELMGYRVDSESDDPADEYPLGVCFFRRQTVSESDMDDAVLALFRLAAKFGGSYDGWETEIIKPQT